MSGFKSINWSPVDYVNSSALAREVGEEMLARLDWLTLNPSCMVDLGCGTGELGAKLQLKYPEAQLISIDNSDTMLTYAKQQPIFVGGVGADAVALPLRTQSVDLLFTNLMLPWCADLKAVLRECRRVLKPEGVFMFSALGPDTIKEWQTCLQLADMPFLFDMHDVGDLMLQEKFADPVLDVNYYTLTYRDATRLVQELHDTGMLSVDAVMPALNEMPSAIDGVWHTTYEVIYGHAFAPSAGDEFAASSDGVVRIPLAHLRRRR